MLVLGRALISRPRLLLLDEPSLGLAPMVTAQLMALLREQTEGKDLTVVLVEQNTRTALSVSKHAVILNLGQVVVSDAAVNVAADERCAAATADCDAMSLLRLHPRRRLNGMICRLALALVLIYRADADHQLRPGEAGMRRPSSPSACCHEAGATGGPS